MKITKLILFFVLCLSMNALDYKITFKYHKFKMPKNPMLYFKKYFVDGKEEITRTQFRNGLTKLY